MLAKSKKEALIFFCLTINQPPLSLFFAFVETKKYQDNKLHFKPKPLEKVRLES